MARLTRQVGIISPQINLPQEDSIGPALVKTTETLQSIVARRGEDRRTQEAQQFAASINFERDAEGNLSAPSLPIGKNGLIAPNVYDRAYTTMITNRYLQQMDVDVETHLAGLANNNILNPEGFKKASEAYIDKVTSLAPDLIRADVNINAQKRMVEHFNRISRETAEFHRDDSKLKQINAIDRIEDEAMQLAVAGDDAGMMEGYLKVVGSLAQGQALNFWGDASTELRLQDFNDKLVSAHLTQLVIGLPTDEVAMDQAVLAIENLRNGHGNVDIVRDGVMVNVPIEEAVPDPERRDIIVNTAIRAIKARKDAFQSFDDARHVRQYDEFTQAFMAKVVDAEFRNGERHGWLGGHADRQWLLDWFDKADAKNNEELKSRIRAELDKATPDLSGRNPTKFELNFMGQTESMERRVGSQQESFAKKNNYDSFALMPQAMQNEWNSSSAAKVAGSYNLPQTDEAARFALDRFTDMFGNTFPDAFFGEEQGGWSADKLEGFIRVQMNQLSVIPLNAINHFGATLGNIENVAGEEIMRMVSMYKVMQEVDGVQGKLETAFGKANYDALNFLSNKMSSSQMNDSALMSDIVESANKGELSTYWVGVLPENRDIMREKVRSSFESLNNPWFSWEGAGIPAPLIAEGMDRIIGGSHKLSHDPSEKELKSLARAIVDELTTSRDSGWRTDELGLNYNKAQEFGRSFGTDIFVGTNLANFGNQQPAIGYSLYPPIYFFPEHTYPGAIEFAVKPALQRLLNKIDGFDVPLRAGENVHLKYNAQASWINNRQPVFEMYVTTTGEAERISMDHNFRDEPIYFAPTQDVLEYVQKGIDDRAIAEDKDKVRRARAARLSFEKPFFNSIGDMSAPFGQQEPVEPLPQSLPSVVQPQLVPQDGTELPDNWPFTDSET